MARKIKEHFSQFGIVSEVIMSIAQGGYQDEAGQEIRKNNTIFIF